MFGMLSQPFTAMAEVQMSMARRWVGAVLLEAEERFHRIQGYREMPLLITALGKAVDVKEAAA